MAIARPIRDRMMEKINRVESGCWEWTSALDSHGYAVISKHNKAAKAYREMYKMFIGPIPDGKCVLHKCDNRKCVNPDHLYIGTKSDNANDRAKRNPWIGPFTGGRMSKFTHEEVVKIKRFIDTNKYSQVELGEMFKCSSATISHIRNGIYKVNR